MSSKKQGKKLSVPRDLNSINVEYQQLCANAGQLQYKIGIETKELANINARIELLNNEASARMQLDKQDEANKAAETTSAEARA